MAHSGLIAAITLIGLASSPALADERMSMFGHTVEIKEVGGLRDLLVDGNTLLKQQMWIDLAQTEMISGIPVVIGTVSGGGNICEAQRFVLSLEKGAPAKFDGPVETCLVVSVDVQQDKIRFTSPARVDLHGQVWDWTYADGLKKVGETDFQLNTKGVWSDLRQRTQQHPFEVLTIGEINAQMTEMLGIEAREYLSIMQGTGSGQFEGDQFFGTVCVPHNCGTAGGFLIADRETKKLYMAWKSMDGDLRIVPSAKQWPHRAKGKLDTWLKTFH